METNRPPQVVVLAGVNGAGKIVEVTPAEIFAYYGFDEFGRPKS